MDIIHWTESPMNSRGTSFDPWRILLEITFQKATSLSLSLSAVIYFTYTYAISPLLWRKKNENPSKLLPSPKEHLLVLYYKTLYMKYTGLYKTSLCRKWNGMAVQIQRAGGRDNPISWPNLCKMSAFCLSCSYKNRACNRASRANGW